MLPNQSKNYIVCIDTGVNTGYAVFDLDKEKFITISTMKIHTAMFNVKDIQESINYVIVEDARLATFGRKRAVDQLKAQGAGSIKRDAKIWEDYLNDLGIKYKMKRPKKSLTKVNANDFKKITGWTGRTSQHARDAAMLIYNFN